MGKGKRSRNTAELKNNLVKQKQSVKMQENRKGKLISLLISGGIILFGIIVVVSSLWVQNLTTTGWFARNKSVIKTKNYKADVCMTQYVFQSLLDQFAENYGETNQELDFDKAKDLKEQSCPYDGYDTWYDYFSTITKNQLSEIITLCEAAEKDGLKLDKGDQRYIKLSMQSLKSLAKEQGLELEEYIDSKYGSIVSAQDIENYLTLTQKATVYQQKYMASLEFNDSEIESHFNENKAQFLSADYTLFLIETGDTEGKSDSEIKAMQLKAKATADNIANSKSRTEFTEKLTKYIKELIKESTPDATSDQINEQAESILDEYAEVTGAEYDVSDDTGEWIFSESRKSGDTTVISNSNGYYVIYLTTPAQKNVSKTKNVRHILLSLEKYDSEADCKIAAENILLKWRNGNKDEQIFATLAERYSDDNGSVTNGGLYENVTEEQFSLTEFNEWLFNPKRQSGDVDIIKTDIGYHIMYFASEGKIAWKSNVISALKVNDYTEHLNQLKELYKPKENDKNFEDVAPITNETEQEEE